MSHSTNTRISGPAANGDYAIVEPGGVIVGEAFHRVSANGLRDAEANARLWAKAPDLRAALEMVWATKESASYIDVKEGGITGYSFYLDESQCAQIRAVLARAGEAGDGS